MTPTSIEALREVAARWREGLVAIADLDQAGAAVRDDYLPLEFSDDELLGAAWGVALAVQLVGESARRQVELGADVSSVVNALEALIPIALATIDKALP